MRYDLPLARDFMAAFGVGEDDKHICPVAAQGVAVAALQGLYQLVPAKDAQFAQQQQIIPRLQQQRQRQQASNKELNARLAAVERLLKPPL